MSEIKTTMVLLTIKKKKVEQGGGIIRFYVEESELDIELTTLHAFVAYRKGTNLPLLLRAKEVEVGDQIWFDTRLAI